jgi:hypothetical protein
MVGNFVNFEAHRYLREIAVHRVSGNANCSPHERSGYFPRIVSGIAAQGDHEVAQMRYNSGCEP